MDVLRPWLGLAVQCELDAVVKWRRSAVDSSQSEAVGEVTYEDDGSNLRVASPRIGVVQITEVCSTTYGRIAYTNQSSLSVPNL